MAHRKSKPRRRTRSRPTTGLRNPSHVVAVRSGFQFASTTVSSAGNYSVGVYATLSNFQDVTHYAAMFDQYRIARMTVTYVPGNQLPYGLATSYNSAILYEVIDPDDSVALASPTSALSYSTCRLHSICERWSRTIVPSVALGVAPSEGTAAYGYNIKKSPWLNTVHTGDEHMGVKVFIGALSTATSQIGFQIIVAADLEFKTPR